MIQIRQQHGLSAENTVPVFHATDSYAKHRKKLMSWYGKEFKTVRLSADHATPKSDAAGVKICDESGSPVKSLLTITADPVHEILQLQRVLRTSLMDFRATLAFFRPATANVSAYAR